ncbi:UNVERIFIED_ORG: type I restriction enzyme S subunit [Pseudomonas cremoricolorata]|nr:type I restriction enzyme S subunit [Pseudomonas cremoricolorata]
MTALLTDNLPLLAGAPNGIKQLRELILELAIRGKLLPQDPNDEPAIEILQPIIEEKAHLVREGKLKKQKPSVNIGTVEKPFDFPKGWLPAYLTDIVAIVTDGDHQPPPKAVEGVPFLVIGNLNTGNIRFEGCRRVPHDYFDALDWGRKPCQGDILYTVTGSFGIPIVVDVDQPFCVQRHVAIIKTTKNLPPEYLRILLASPYAKNYAALIATGIAQKTVPLTGLRQLIVPLPPLAEQHRIVAKVDELMDLCDRLETQQTNVGNAHAQLVQALLDSLTQASDATDFATNWQRLAEHFHTLFTTEPSIGALKQTLLQLAVMGKLVPQDSADESADKLLKRISDHRSTYREKKQKSFADTTEVERPFELPCQWVWTTLPAIGELARGKSRHRPRNDPSLYAGGNVPLIQTGDVARANGVVKTHSAMYNTKGVEQSRLWPAGTMCITIAANIADSATLGFDACFPDSVVGFIPEFPELDVRYFEFFLRTAKSHLEDFAPSTAQKNINLEILGLLSVPLPPANEVRRIVAKVDQLMALCDQLKDRLTQARQMNEQLASTLVEQAVA